MGLSTTTLDRCPACGETNCRLCTEPGCGLRYCAHHPCPVCGSALEHTRLHPDGVTTGEEWDGRARMAACKVAAGLAMTDVEAEALRRVPDPTFLCGDCWDYQPRGHACPAVSPAPPDPAPHADAETASPCGEHTAPHSASPLVASPPAEPVVAPAPHERPGGDR